VASFVLSTFFVEPRGNCFTTSHFFGRRYAASSLFAHRSISAGLRDAPFFGTTAAPTTLPFVSSAIASTAASETFGCLRISSSTSTGKTE